MNNNQAKLRDH